MVAETVTPGAPIMVVNGLILVVSLSSGEQSRYVASRKRPRLAVTPEEYFAEHPLPLAVFRKVYAIVDRCGPFDLRVSKSQVAFRRKRGFAYLWMPGKYVRKPGAEIVLSLCLGRRDDSKRFKQVAHPTPWNWIHHLEVHHIDDIDDEVARWLQEAADYAS